VLGHEAAREREREVERQRLPTAAPLRRTFHGHMLGIQLTARQTLEKLWKLARFQFEFKSRNITDCS